MTPTIKNPLRCAALVVACLLAAARGEWTLAQDLAPDSYFQPIADKSFPVMPPVILRSVKIAMATSGSPVLEGRFGTTARCSQTLPKKQESRDSASFRSSSTSLARFGSAQS